MSAPVRLRRTRNTIRNMRAGLCNKALSLLLPFAVRTVLIRRIGAEYVGLNGLFTSILQVLNLSELGFSSAVVQAMYRPVAEGDREAVCRLLNFYRRAYRAVALVILAAGLCVLPFLRRLIKGEVPAGIDIRILYLVFLLNTAISYLTFGYRQSLFSAFQRQDILSNIQTLTTAGLSAAQIVLLVFWKSYYGYVLAMPVFTVLNNVIVAAVSHREFPSYSCGGGLSDGQKKDMNRKIGGLLVSRLCQTSRNSLDSIFISAFLGLTATAIYSNYFLVMSTVTGFLGIITGSMTAGVGNSIQTETKEKNYADMRKFNFLYMWISGWCACCMLCLYQPFMELWAGKDKMLPLGVVILFCLYFYLLKCGDVRSLYADATGIWWESRWRAVSEAAANLALNFLFVKRFGVRGAVAGTLISLFIFNFIGGSQIFFHCYFGRGRETTKKIAAYFCGHGVFFSVTCLAAFCCMAVSGLIVRKTNPRPLSVLLVTFAVCAVLPNAVYLVCYFRRDEFRAAVCGFRRYGKCACEH